MFRQLRHREHPRLAIISEPQAAHRRRQVRQIKAAESAQREHGQLLQRLKDGAVERGGPVGQADVAFEVQVLWRGRNGAGQKSIMAVAQSVAIGWISSNCKWPWAQSAWDQHAQLQQLLCHGCTPPVTAPTAAAPCKCTSLCTRLPRKPGAHPQLRQGR